MVFVYVYTTNKFTTHPQCEPISSSVSILNILHDVIMWSGMRKYPNHSSMSVRHSCQKMLEDTVKNGQQAKQIQGSSFSLQKNNKLQDPIVYTEATEGSVTRVREGRFTVK